MAGFMTLLYIIPASFSAALIWQEWVVVGTWLVLGVFFYFYSKRKYGAEFGRDIFIVDEDKSDVTENEASHIAAINKKYEGKHFVVTVGCEYGSGGPEIAKMVADYFGIEYYNRDLVDKVVEQIGVDKGLVEEADTKIGVRYGFDTSYGVRYANLSNRVIDAQFQTIHDFAEKSSCVIVGRSSDYILRDRNDVLNVLPHNACGIAASLLSRSAFDFGPGTCLVIISGNAFAKSFVVINLSSLNYKKAPDLSISKYLIRRLCLCFI